jgi:hypothetical protein
MQEGLEPCKEKVLRRFDLLYNTYIIYKKKKIIKERGSMNTLPIYIFYYYEIWHIIFFLLG